MTTEELADLFETFDEEYLQFDRVKEKRSERRDIHAFLLLAELVPSKCPIIDDAEHDEIWLDVDVDALAAVATEEIVCELNRCGVRFDEDHQRLAMFV